LSAWNDGSQGGRVSGVVVVVAAAGVAASVVAAAAASAVVGYALMLKGGCYRIRK
jgi:hypothetical protein